MDPGLCQTCAHAKVVTSDRGSIFYRCQLADSNPRYPKYPRLPVLNCAGWVDAENTPSSTTTHRSQN